MIQLDGELRVGAFDAETDTYPVYLLIDQYYYGAVAEFYSQELAEEWAKWKNERAA